MTIETFAFLWWSPFIIAFFVVPITHAIHDWKHYGPDDWGR